jgi:hypothetical protein
LEIEILEANLLVRQSKIERLRNRFKSAFHFVEAVVIFAATRVTCHPTFSAFIAIRAFIQVNAGFLSHAIVNIYHNASRSGHIHQGQYG